MLAPRTLSPPDSLGATQGREQSRGWGSREGGQEVRDALPWGLPRTQTCPPLPRESGTLRRLAPEIQSAELGGRLQLSAGENVPGSEAGEVEPPRPEVGAPAS